MHTYRSQLVATKAQCQQKSHKLSCEIQKEYANNTLLITECTSMPCNGSPHVHWASMQDWRTLHEIRDFPHCSVSTSTPRVLSRAQKGVVPPAVRPRRATKRDPAHVAPFLRNRALTVPSPVTQFTRYMDGRKKMVSQSVSSSV